VGLRLLAPPQRFVASSTLVERFKSPFHNLKLEIECLEKRCENKIFSSITANGIYSLSGGGDRKSTRLNSSHVSISYAVFCLKKKRSKKRQRAVIDVKI